MEMPEEREGADEEGAQGSRRPLCRDISRVSGEDSEEGYPIKVLTLGSQTPRPSLFSPHDLLEIDMLRASWAGRYSGCGHSAMLAAEEEVCRHAICFLLALISTALIAHRSIGLHGPIAERSAAAEPKVECLILWSDCARAPWRSVRATRAGV